MNRRTLNILLLLVFLLVVTATFLVRAVPTERNLEVLPGMLFSVPGDPQNDLLPMQPGNAPLNAVPGTISRGAPLFPSETTPADSVLPAALLSAPASIDSDRAVARGAKVFGVFCSPCHGSGGTGDGTIAMRGYPPPPSLLAPNAVTMTNERMYMIITQGFRNMPSYLSQVSANDRWAAIYHIRAMQAAVISVTTTATDTVSAVQPIVEATP